MSRARPLGPSERPDQASCVRVQQSPRKVRTALGLGGFGGLGGFRAGLGLLFLSGCCLANAAERPPGNAENAGNVGDSTAGLTTAAVRRQPDGWFESGVGRAALANLLSHQSARGDWPKNIRTLAQRSTEAPASIVSPPGAAFIR